MMNLIVSLLRGMLYSPANWYLYPLVLWSLWSTYVIWAWDRHDGRLPLFARSHVIYALFETDWALSRPTLRAAVGLYLTGLIPFITLACLVSSCAIVFCQLALTGYEASWSVLRPSRSV
jgi:hypothetical protein